MIWARVSSWSCFCWLYRVSPPSAAKNIVNLILVMTMVMPMCRAFSCVVGKGCLLWPVRSLGKTVLTFALLFSQDCFRLFVVPSKFLDCFSFTSVKNAIWVLVGISLNFQMVFGSSDILTILILPTLDIFPFICVFYFFHHSFMISEWRSFISLISYS